MVQICDLSSCTPPLFESLVVEFDLSAGEARADRLEPMLEVPEQPEGWLDQEAYNAAYPPSAYVPEPPEGPVPPLIPPPEDGLWKYMVFAFVAGLLALATPCVWPMIPITVSFFSKQQGEGGKTSIKGPLAYSLGIITTFTGIGVVMSIIFGASGVQRLAASPWVNGFLALLFVVLALNLFGVYELVMPQALVNKFNKKGQSGGIAGPIFMGLAFSLTSFTCTVPFAGTVLAGAANGDYFYPAMGMLAFSLAFALPFFGLALFPQYLARMPKSGTWLTTVKAFMGFLELAAAMKFLSNMDLVLAWEFITKPVFLSIWFGIFAVAGFYMMGWIRLPHDVPDVKIGPGRRVTGVLSIALGVYWLFAINGAPLGNMSAFVPPSAYGQQAGTSVGGINWVHNIDEGVELANEEGKLIFVNFTGWTCSNCRVMEEEIFPTAEVKAEIDKFVAVELYTDRGTPEENANDALRTELTGVSTNPVYVVLNEDREVLSVAQGMQSKEDFIAFLKAGQAKLTASR
jgi:thiol:disulfide interchange protein DsbD